MTGRRVRMLALHPLWRKARRVYSLASRLPGTNRLGFQPSLALSEGFNSQHHQTHSFHTPPWLYSACIYWHVSRSMINKC
ncbi:MAG: hypothetical protein LC541_13085 [Candidatus Thiodiazotropha sp.]|nr:hypothetical protein [Candidatus Thiodiazotropha sp.]MCM8884206.1 hypothetical protein [Candidatus Thiodiazotropha sp.]MCM8922124.1 hypothetical protein [Candidatus Thiodiazotropha sp.]